MTAPLAVFRADASPVIGGGHVQRCLVLADALAAAGWRCAFALREGTLATVPALAQSGCEIFTLGGGEDGEPQALAARWPSGCALLVVDNYRRGARFEAACRPWARRILAIDDLAARPHDCDLLLDANLGREAADYAGLIPDGCRLLLGPDYALLRPQFAAARDAALARRRGDGPVRRILISLGTTDPGNVTVRVLEAVARSGVDAALDVVLGAAAPHLAALRDRLAHDPGRARLHVAVSDMAALMAGADLAIGAAGTSSWERCCLAVPSLVIVVADNQRVVASALARSHAAEVVGEGAALDVGALAQAVARLAGDPGRRAEMAARASALCDGRGAARVLAAIVAHSDSARGPALCPGA